MRQAYKVCRQPRDMLWNKVRGQEKMKRRDFLKSILATPAVIGIAKAKNDLDVLKVPSFSPKPSEVEMPKECSDEDVSEGVLSGSVTYSCSPSAECLDNIPWIDDIDSKYL
jgi:hypothetical protein